MILQQKNFHPKHSRPKNIRPTFFHLNYLRGYDLATKKISTKTFFGQ